MKYGLLVWLLFFSTHCVTKKNTPENEQTASQTPPSHSSALAEKDAGASKKSCSLIRDQSACTQFFGCVLAGPGCFGKILKEPKDFQDLIHDETLGISYEDALGTKHLRTLWKERDFILPVSQKLGVRPKDLLKAKQFVLKDFEDVEKLFLQKEKNFKEHYFENWSLLLQYPDLREKAKALGVDYNHLLQMDLNDDNTYEVLRNPQTYKEYAEKYHVSIDVILQAPYFYNLRSTSTLDKDLETLGINFTEFLTLNSLWNMKEAASRAEVLGFPKSDFIKLNRISYFPSGADRLKEFFKIFPFDAESMNRPDFYDIVYSDFDVLKKLLEDENIALKDLPYCARSIHSQDITRLRKDLGLDLAYILQWNSSTLDSILRKPPIKLKQLAEIGLSLETLTQSGVINEVYERLDEIPELLKELEMTADQFLQSPDKRFLLDNYKYIAEFQKKTGVNFTSVSNIYLFDESGNDRNHILMNKFLFWAIEHDRFDSFKKALELGANPHMPNSNTLTPYAFAKSLGRKDIITHLQKIKAADEKFIVRKIKDYKKTLHCTVDGISPFEESSKGQCFDVERKFLLSPKVSAILKQQIDYWKQGGFHNVKLESSQPVVAEYKGNSEMFNLTRGTFDGKVPLWQSLEQFETDRKKTLARQVDAITFSILAAPKFSTGVNVYRGLRGCIDAYVQSPRSLLSTSIDPHVSVDWIGGPESPETCFLEIQLPPGYPLFYLNIARDEDENLREFLLPFYYLDERGELVEARYDMIRKEEKTYISHYMANEIQLVTMTTEVVRPHAPLVYEPSRDHSIEQFQISYLEKLCKPSHTEGLPTLEDICKLAKKYWSEQLAKKAHK